MQEVQSIQCLSQWVPHRCDDRYAACSLRLFQACLRLKLRRPFLIARLPNRRLRKNKKSLSDQRNSRLTSATLRLNGLTRKWLASPVPALCAALTNGRYLMTLSPRHYSGTTVRQECFWARITHTSCSLARRARTFNSSMPSRLELSPLRKREKTRRDWTGGKTTSRRAGGHVYHAAAAH